MTLDDAYCQRNPLWAPRPLGTKRASTISQHGCLLCAITHAAAAALADNSLRPWEFNQLLLERDGFEQGNLVKHGVAAALMGCVYAEGRDYSGPMPDADLAIVERHLAAGYVFVKVNYNVGGRFSEHWLRLLERHYDAPWREPAGRSVVYDPWYGAVLPYMESYYSPGGQRGPGYAWWGWRAYRRQAEAGHV